MGNKGCYVIYQCISWVSPVHLLRKAWAPSAVSVTSLVGFFRNSNLQLKARTHPIICSEGWIPGLYQHWLSDWKFWVYQVCVMTLEPPPKILRCLVNFLPNNRFSDFLRLRAFVNKNLDVA